MANNEQARSSRDFYYWRDYTGAIYKDAFVAGNDINRKTVYIAQTWTNYGLLTGTINLQQSTVEAAYYGRVHSCKGGNKILCIEKPEKFSWMPVTSQNFHQQAIAKELVPGGYSCYGQMFNIGRAHYQGGEVVGNVLGFNTSGAKLEVSYNNAQVEFDSYEVLIFNN